MLFGKLRYIQTNTIKKIRGGEPLVIAVVGINQVYLQLGKRTVVYKYLDSFFLSLSFFSSFSSLFYYYFTYQ